jgi:hypothetical protein
VYNTNSIERSNVKGLREYNTIKEILLDLVGKRVRTRRINGRGEK